MVEDLVSRQKAKWPIWQYLEFKLIANREPGWVYEGQGIGYLAEKLEVAACWKCMLSCFLDVIFDEQMTTHHLLWLLHNNSQLMPVECCLCQAAAVGNVWLALAMPKYCTVRMSSVIGKTSVVMSFTSSGNIWPQLQPYSALHPTLKGNSIKLSF